jgi:Beta propeller domain
LFPINTNKTLLLSIGAIADTLGSNTALQLILFDVTVPTSPFVKFRYDIERSHSDSSITMDSWWDRKATRFYDGHLFLVVDIDKWDSTTDTLSSTPSSFHRTMVFTVDVATGIAKKTACHASYNKISYYTDIYTNTYQEDKLSTTNSSDHAKGMQSCNYTNGSLPRRSMLFGDTFLSTSGPEVIWTNTCQRIQISDQCQQQLQ